MKLIATALFLGSALLAACADPAANKPKAQTSEPTSNTAAKPEAINLAATDVFSGFKAKGAELTVDPGTSKVEFTGSKVTGKHDGGFKTFKGIIDLIGDKAADSRVLFEIDMASVFTDADGLTKHLQSGDFFEVAKYPKSSFVSTKIVSDPSKGADDYTVTGDLEMRGVKKSVTFPAKITVGPSEAVVESEFSINRKDFGILYAGKADDLIRDDVVLKLKLQAPRKK